jgi:tetratricopeptide (TPR) repeat protein
MDDGTGSVFVGREAELATLAGALREAESGHGAMVAIVGDAGIGKTRTVEEFVRRAALPDGRVLWGRCPEQGGAPSYWPWRQALRRHVEAQPPETLRAELGESAPDVAALVPALRDRLGVTEGVPGADADQARFRLFDGVTRLLSHAAAHAPLVLVLDDLHWADHASLALLEFVARELRETHLLVLGTYRDGEMRRLPRLLGTIARIGRRVPLGGFDRSDVERFVAESGGSLPSGTLVSRLHETTEGNPFFLGELVQSLKSGGGLDASEPDASRLRLPDSVREATRRRLEPLAEDDRRVLDVAAALGREFDLVSLGAACDLASGVVLERLAAPAAAGLVDEVTGRVGRWRFAHALIRETLYHDLLPAGRAELHRRIAHALQALHDAGRETPPAELAHHYYHAAALGEGEKAVDYAERAAAQALKLFAHDEALLHCERALAAQRLLPPDEPRRLRLLLALGDAAARLGDVGKARDTLERAARLAGTLGEHESLARAALALGRARVVAGRVDLRLVTLLEDALAALDPSDSPLRAALLGRLAAALYYSPDVERLDRLTADGLAMARRLGHPGIIAGALLARLLAVWGLRPVAERAALVDEAAPLAVRVGSTGLILECQSWRIVNRLEAGDVAGAEAELATYTAEAERLRSSTRRWHAALVRAAIDLLRGRFAEAGRSAADALAARQRGDDPNVPQLFLCQMYQIRREAGDFETLEAPLTSMARENPGTQVWLAGLALLHAEHGQAALARAELDVIAARDFADLLPDANALVMLVFLAEIVAALGDAERARLLHPRLLPHRDRNVLTSIAAVCHGSAARYLGLLAATMGDADAAVRHYETALAANARLGALPQLARTQADYARVLAGRGRPGDEARARELLGRARETAQILGMARFAARLPTLPERGTPAPPPAAPAPVATGRASQGVLRRDGDTWTVGLGDERTLLKHAKGLSFLAALLARPGQEFHVLDLVQLESPLDARADAAGGGAPDAGALLDQEARAAYKRRLEDLRDDLEEAERFNDPHRAERARVEIELLAGELSHVVGLAGRDRPNTAAVERARINVGRAVSHALKKIAEGSPLASEHLQASVRTGVLCAYEPRVSIEWSLTP